MPSKTIRLDKWLWHARVTKTRSLAQKLVTGGHVRVNRLKTATASHKISCGDTLTIRLEKIVLVCAIVALGERRGPFAEARLLYDDLSPSPVRQLAGNQHADDSAAG